MPLGTNIQTYFSLANAAAAYYYTIQRFGNLESKTYNTHMYQNDGILINLFLIDLISEKQMCRKLSMGLVMNI